LMKFLFSLDLIKNFSISESIDFASFSYEAASV
jgi:hypothetical protein